MAHRRQPSEVHLLSRLQTLSANDQLVISPESHSNMPQSNMAKTRQTSKIPHGSSRSSPPPPPPPPSATQDANSDVDPGTLKYHALIDHIAGPVRRCPKKFVPQDLLNRLKIQRVPLDFKTGTLAPGVVPFLKPKTAEEVKAILAVTKPWENDPYWSSLGSDKMDDDLEYGNPKHWETSDVPSYRFNEDAHLGDFICHYLETAVDVGPGYELQETSRWRRWQPVITKCLDRTASYNDRWEIYPSLVHLAPEATNLNEIPDHTRPHVICQSIGSNILEEEKILTNELSAVIWLACNVALDDNYRRSSMVEVTVFSKCHLDVRIVQGDVNFEEQTVTLRVFPIQSFKGGIQVEGANWTKFSQLLGCVADLVQPSL